jgi:2-isopropylmalate synthase
MRKVRMAMDAKDGEMQAARKQYWQDCIGIIPSRVLVFDTTLRDGEQTPGVNLSAEKKFQIALALDGLGVDVIEAGFPASSDGERELFRRLSQEGLRASVCGLCRASKADIDAAIGSGANYIHIFLATSELHMRHKLRMTREQVLSKAIESVEYARSHGVPVEFSAEDATRSDPEFLKQVYWAVERSGACMLNVPDTVGVSSPRQYFALVNEVRSATSAPVSVHCHDDFGMAVANTLAGVEAGASQIQVTINGLGERAGNAALEESVMALSEIYGIETGVQKEKLYELSQMVSRATRVWPSPNKAIVGDNAFSHAAGIHVHGVLSHALAYEPFEPKKVGRKRAIVLGKLTGSNAVRSVLEGLGFRLDDGQVKRITAKVKEIGDTGRRVRDL